MFGYESARMPCSISLFLVVCVLFSQQCPCSSRRLRELKAAAPRSRRRQESKRSSPLCRARIRRPPTSAGRLGRRASRLLGPGPCRGTLVAALARTTSVPEQEGQNGGGVPCCALQAELRRDFGAEAALIKGKGRSRCRQLRSSWPLSHCSSNLINMIHVNNSNSLNKRTRA